MNTEYYRLLGFLDVVSTMLDKKELRIKNTKTNPVALGKQLAGARKVLLAEAMKMQRASAEFEANVKPARAIIAEVMQLLRAGGAKLAPVVAAHLDEYSHSANLGGGEDCSTKPPPISSSSSRKGLGGGEDCSTKPPPISSSSSRKGLGGGEDCSTKPPPISSSSSRKGLGGGEDCSTKIRVSSSSTSTAAMRRRAR